MFGRVTLKHTLAGVVLTAGLLSGGCATTTVSNIPLGTVPQPQQPSTQELKVSRALIGKHLSEGQGYTVYNKGREQRRVQRIVNRLAQAAGANGYSYPVYVADAGDRVNALAIQGNSIVVYRELLRRVRNDAELATVLAHEIAHIVARHADDDTAQSRRKSVQAGSTALGIFASLATSIAGAPEMAGLAGSVTETVTVTVGEGAIVRAYDRAMEHEADHVGLMIMAKAGYDPQAAVDFWRRSKTIFGNSNEAAFFSTHPADSSRAERLRQAMPLALRYYAAARQRTPTTGRKPVWPQTLAG